MKRKRLTVALGIFLIAWPLLVLAGILLWAYPGGFAVLSGAALFVCSIWAGTHLVVGRQ